MNREAIKRTAVCYWSDEDDGYIVDSLIFQRCGAVADTEKDAWRLFKEFLNQTYVDYVDGKLAGYSKPKPGRPAKGGVEIHVQVQPTTKKRIAELAENFGCSQGEVIDYLTNYREIAVLPAKPAQAVETLKRTSPAATSVGTTSTTTGTRATARRVAGTR